MKRSRKFWQAIESGFSCSLIWFLPSNETGASSLQCLHDMVEAHSYAATASLRCFLPILGLTSDHAASQIQAIDLEQVISEVSVFGADRMFYTAAGSRRIQTPDINMQLAGRTVTFWQVPILLQKMIVLTDFWSLMTWSIAVALRMNAVSSLISSPPLQSMSCSNEPGAGLQLRKLANHIFLLLLCSAQVYQIA